MAVRQGSVVKDSDSSTVPIATSVTADVAAKFVDVAVRPGLGRADIVRLAQAHLVPPESFSTGDALRLVWRMR